MARKKQEIALQRELNTQEEWDDVMAKEGLWIVDIYQDWCGPCKSILSHFRRIKNESGEDLLQFAVAKADTIDSLDRYRGNCKPCFLFYGSGTLVEVIRGVNPPELENKIKAHLVNELKVLKGEPGAERVEIRDPAFKHLDEAERLAKQKTDDDEEEEIEREVTVVLIKPDAKHKVDEIRQRLEERGIEILEQQERKLTYEEAKDFYRHLEDQEWFEQMINYMTSGESIVLVISKGNSGIISEFREILGPANVEDAKQSQPDSLRAIFGTDTFKNAIHAADSGEKATKELEFFFPEFKIPTYKVHRAKKEKHREIEKTVALIRPDAFVEFKDEILAKIKEAGFSIALKKEVQLTKEQAEEFYSEKKDSPFFGELIARMTNGPVLALALAKEDAIKEWRCALGEKDPKEAKAAHPHSFRAMYSKEDIQINLLHGSDSTNSARMELEFFFPVEQTLIVIKPDAYENRDEIIQKAKEAEFIIAAQKEVRLRPEMAREFYKAHAGKEFFDDLVAHMTSGKSVFLVLSRPDAVTGWRQLMGDPDPTKAAEDDHSIRSIFGKDIKSNAVHGSGSKEHATESIRLIFGNIAFDHEGRRIAGTGDFTEEEEPSTEEEGEMRGPHGEIVRTDAQRAQASDHKGEHHEGKPHKSEHQGGTPHKGKAKGKGKGKGHKGKPKGEHHEGEQDEGEEDGGEEGEGEEGEGEEGEGEEGEGEEGEDEHHEGEQDEGEHKEDAQDAGEHQEGEHHDGEQHEGEQHEPEHHEGEQHEPEHHEGEQHEGEQHEGEQHEPEHHEAEHHEAEHHEAEQHEPEHHEAEHHEGEHHEGEHHEGEHHEDEHHEDEHHEAEHHEAEHHEAEHHEGGHHGAEHHEAGGEHSGGGGGEEVHGGEIQE